MRVIDEWGDGFGWIHPEPRWLERASHALVADGRVWVVDPTDVPGATERVRALGEPAGVVQLLDRHARDCALFAERLGVPLHVVPFGGVAGAPFEVLRVLDVPRWREVALWLPGDALVVADAVGTAPHYVAPGERLAVNPVLRLLPPRRLRGLEPRSIRCGHGAGVRGDDTASLLAEALAKSRRRTLSWVAGQIRRSSQRSTAARRSGAAERLPADDADG